MRHTFARAIQYAAAGGGDLEGYTFKVLTTSSSETFTFLTAGTVNYNVDWGDGSSDSGVTSNSWPHIYSAAGLYTVTVTTAVPFRLTSTDAVPKQIIEVVGQNAGFPWGVDLSNSWRGQNQMTTFAPLDLSSVQSLGFAWRGCSSLQAFPMMDLSSVTIARQAWTSNSSLTSFPPIDLPLSTTCQETWMSCDSLTSFPAIDCGSSTTFQSAWNGCSSLVTMGLVNVASGRTFNLAWSGCGSLVDFPAGFFDVMGVPNNNCFVNAWGNTVSLSASSVENILNSIATSGRSAPGAGPIITISYDTASGTPDIASAVATLQSRGWGIIINGVTQ